MGSSHSIRAPSRATSASRCGHFSTCQFWRSISERTHGERVSFRRSSSARSAGMTRKRACCSEVGIWLPRRRTASPSMAVHSTSNR